MFKPKKSIDKDQAISNIKQQVQQDEDEEYVDQAEEEVEVEEEPTSEVKPNFTNVEIAAAIKYNLERAHQLLGMLN